MNYKFIKFGPEGYPLFYYDELTYPPVLNDDGEPIANNRDIPAGAQPVSDQQWMDAQSMKLWLSPGGNITVPPDPVPIELPEPVTVLPAMTLWERMTEDEAVSVTEAMKTQTPRTVQIFNNAATFRSDHELWPLLEQTATQLFGQDRAAELLAP